MNNEKEQTVFNRTFKLGVDARHEPEFKIIDENSPINDLIVLIEDKILIYQSYQKNSYLNTDMFYKEIRELQMVKEWAIQINKTYGGNK